MEVVINIQQKVYEQIVGFPQQTTGVDIFILHKILQEGKVLPKGHGALKDVDAIWESMKKHRYSDGFCVTHDIDYSINLEMSGIVLRDAQTIIEADKEVDE